MLGTVAASLAVVVGGLLFAWYAWYWVSPHSRRA